MSEISRRKIIGGTLTSSLALLAGKASATGPDAGAQTQNFKSNGAGSMSLGEFRELNGAGSVSRLMGEMKCDLLAMCHKRMKEEQGIWIPELEPLFKEIDARANPSAS